MPTATVVGVTAALPAHADTQICSQYRIDHDPGRQVHRAEQRLGRLDHAVHQRDQQRLHGHLGRAQPAAERRTRRVPVRVRRMPLRQLQHRQRAAAAGQRQPVRHDLDQRGHVVPEQRQRLRRLVRHLVRPDAAHRRPEHRRRADGLAQPHRLGARRRFTGRHRQPSPAPPGTSGTATTAGTSCPTSGRARPRRSASTSRPSTPTWSGAGTPRTPGT